MLIFQSVVTQNEFLFTLEITVHCTIKGVCAQLALCAVHGFKSNSFLFRINNYLPSQNLNPGPPRQQAAKLTIEL